MVRRWCLAVVPGLVVLALGGRAAAQTSATEVTPSAGLGYAEHSSRYARQSATLLGTATLAGGGALIDLASSEVSVFATQLSMAGRFVVNGVAIEPRLGILAAVTASTATRATNVTVNVVPGLAVGYAFPISATMALTPMLSYAVLLATVNNTNLVPGHQLAAELPLSVFFGRNGMLEPYAFLGVTVPSRADASVVLGAGLRVGVTF